MPLWFSAFAPLLPSPGNGPAVSSGTAESPVSALVVVAAAEPAPPGGAPPGGAPPGGGPPGPPFGCPEGCADGVAVVGADAAPESSPPQAARNAAAPAPTASPSMRLRVKIVPTSNARPSSWWSSVMGRVCPPKFGAAAHPASFLRTFRVPRPRRAHRRSAAAPSPWRTSWRSRSCARRRGGRRRAVAEPPADEHAASPSSTAAATTPPNRLTPSRCTRTVVCQSSWRDGGAFAGLLRRHQAAVRRGARPAPRDTDPRERHSSPPS